jgi:hypothetical protein
MRVEPHGPGDAVLSGSAAAAQARTFLLASTAECGPRTASFEIHPKKDLPNQFWPDNPPSRIQFRLAVVLALTRTRRI